MERIFLWKQAESAGTGSSADDFAPYLEPYLLENSGAPRGCVIVFPGGGYCRRAPHEGGPIAERFNRMGFHACVLQYRVAPYRYPAPQRDALRAVRLVRSRAAEWGIAPDRIATLGFSAAGHLCASSGTLYDEVDSTAGDVADNFSARPDALILCYAVINLTDPFGHYGSGENLLGRDGMLSPAAKRLNLETRVTADTPPSFLWHTAEDSCVNVENSLAFARELWKNQVTAEVHVFPHGCHGLGLAPAMRDVAQWPELAGCFLMESCGFPARV